MKLTRKLIERHFPGARVSGRLRGGYLVKNRSTGGRVVIKDTGFTEIKGGADIHTGMISLGRELWPKQRLVARGPTEFIMNNVILGQMYGVEVEAGGRKRWFGLKTDPPPVIPKPSGAHGTAGIATDEMLRAARLTGGKRGDGLRVGEDSAGNVVRYTGSNSVFVIGPSGSGKQTALLTSMIIEAEQTSLVIYDPKCELLPITYRRRKSLGPVRIICPYREGLPEACSHFADETDSYEPLSVLLDPKSEAYVGNSDAMSAVSVGPDDSGESRGTGFFTDNGQTAVSGVLMQLVENYPGEANLPEMASIICSNRIFEFAATATKTGSRFVRDRLSTFGTPDAPLLKGGIGDILRTMRGQNKWLSDPAITRVFGQQESPWCFDDLKRGPRPSTVYVCVSPKFANISPRLFRMLFGCAAMEWQATPQGRWPVTVLADEFPLLGRAQIFPTIFAEGRAHGIRVVAVCQSAGQMIGAYGEQGFRNLLACSGLQIWYPPKEYQTASEIARLAGRKTLLTMNHSAAPGGRNNSAWGGISVGETGADVLTPHQVMGMDSTQLIAFAPGLVPDVMILRRRNYWEYPDIKRLTDANPYAPGYKPPRMPARKSQPMPRRTESLESKIERWRSQRKKIS